MSDKRTDTVFDSDGDNTAQSGRASGTLLGYVHVLNINTTQGFLQLFDAATTAVSVGTTTPKLSFLVPAGDGTNYGAFEANFDPPIQFQTALTYACTTTPTSNGDPSTGLIVNLVIY